MLYLNQLDYTHIPYRTKVKKDIPPEQMMRSVRKSGCGLCCDVQTVHAETKADKIKYHLFARKR